MAQKKFKPALADCQQAASLQADAPSVKTLTRLARCQLSTGSTAPALSTLRSVLELEPKNAAALQLQKKVLELEAHLRNFEGAKARRDWAMARLALDKCIQSMDAEGGDIPTQWRLWRVELELARGSWDATLAAMAGLIDARMADRGRAEAVVSPRIASRPTATPSCARRLPSSSTILMSMPSGGRPWRTTLCSCSSGDSAATAAVGELTVPMGEFSVMPQP